MARGANATTTNAEKAAAPSSSSARRDGGSALAVLLRVNGQRTMTGVALALAWSASAGVAKADDASPGESWARMPIAIDVQMGLGTPYGLAGMSLEVSPIRYWTLAGGAGWAFHGWQLAASTRGRYPISSTGALALGVGLSRGAYEQCESCFMDDPQWRKDWDRAYWFSAELSAEHQSMSGMRSRFYFGIEKLLNPSAGVCTSNFNRIPDCVASSHGEMLVYLGVAIGHAVPIVFQTRR